MITITDSSGAEEFYSVFEKTEDEVPFKIVNDNTWVTLKYALSYKEQLETEFSKKVFRIFKIEIKEINIYGIN